MTAKEFPWRGYYDTREQWQEKAAENREALRRQRQAERNRRLELIQAEIRHAESTGCDFCKDLGNAFNLKYDCDQRYGLVIDDNRDNEHASCPECGRVVASWS